MVDTATMPTLHVSGLDDIDVGEFKPKPTSLSEGQMEAMATLWTSPDGSVTAGVWECTPGRFAATRDGFSEIAHVIKGRFKITNPDGSVTEHGPGDMVVTNSGWRGTWEVTETIRKVWIIQRDS
ncbi:MAG TPA: cupin domain-containing protein [Thermomicrobiales bacterium]|nr:cupin domain-containing protein [Thermomicrobiales bacterium]